MDMLGCNVLSDLPPEVLNEIFLNLPSREILMNIELVCKAWYGIVNHTRFWFQRLKFLGFPLCIDVRRDLLSLSNDEEEWLRCLQETCYYIEASQKQKTQHLFGTSPTINILRDWEEDGRWHITEDKLRVAAIMLCLRKPLFVEIELYSNSNCLKQLGLFMNKLATVYCEINVKDFGSWRQLRESSTVDILCRLKLISLCKVMEILAAVNTTDSLPTTIEKLHLGLLVDPATGAARDPGLVNLTHHCRQLNWLSVHVRAGTVTEHLPHLPDVTWTDEDQDVRSSTSLYLSQLSDDCHLQWAVDTARTLQPPRGYCHLVLPSCSLRVEQLCELMGRLSDVGVTVNSTVTVSSYFSQKEEQQLWYATVALPCVFNWYQDDVELSQHEDSPGW